MHKLVFYVPVADAEAVKAAVFDAGGGRLGCYDQCCWQVLGQGQFRPLAGSNPHIGQRGALENVDELRVELVVDDPQIKAVVAALKQAHPYEQPAYDVWRLADF